MNRPSQIENKKELIEKFVLVLLLIIPSLLFAQAGIPDSVVSSNIVSFQKPGTFKYVIPAKCVTTITVQVWGGGGAGRGVASGATNGGGGGGGGGYSSSTLTVTPGQTYTLAVGNPGAGSTGSGTDGGDSWFNTNAILLARGGKGSTGTTGGAGAAVGIGTVKIAGAAGGNYANDGGGGGGGEGGPTGTATAGGNGAAGGTGGGGGAGANGGGAGGAGGNNNGVGTDNTYCPVCGGGGGAGTNGGTGGGGSGGRIVITLPAPLSVIVTNPQTICPGATPTTFTATATGQNGGPYTYAWQSSTTDSITNSGFNTAAGTSTNSTYTSPVGLSVTTWFRCIINSSNCNPDTSEAVKVVITNLSGTITFPQTICSGSTPTTLTSSIIPSTAPATYQWQSSTTNGTSGFGTATGTSTNSTYSPGTVSSPIWYNAIISAPGCVTYTTSAISITPSNVPSTCNAGTSKTIYNVNTLTLTGTGVGGSVTTGAWSISSGGGTLSNTAQTNNPASVAYTPAAGYTGTVVLKLTTNSNGCAPVSVCTKTINVLPSTITTVTYTTAGDFTWTVPGCVNSATIQTWGAGGGGGAGGSQFQDDGSGGGGGAFSSSILSMTQGTVYNLHVGAGGSGAVHTGTGTKGGNGEGSWFGSTSTVFAQGGTGGLGYGQPGYGNTSPGGSINAGIGTVKHSGGYGVSGCLWPGGGGGASGCPTANGNNAPPASNNNCGGASATSTPGATACAGGGAGGKGAESNGGPGITGPCTVAAQLSTPGGFPGGGGGGGCNWCDYKGEAGAQGQVIITYGPAFPIIITANSTTVCQGQSAQLIANTDFPTQFIWSTGKTSANVESDTITVTPATTTTYTVKDVSGCATPVTVTVTISPAFTPTVTSATVCSGTAATLTASGATTYVWSTGVSAASMTATPTITTTYSVTATKNGCSINATGKITVNPLPVVAATSATICNSQSATLTVSGATTYVWSNGTSGSTMTASPASTTNYTVTGTSLGCIAIATATIAVQSAYIIPVTSVTICSGQTATLTASGSTTYSWSTGATTTTITASPTSTTTYTISGTSGVCNGSGSGTVTVNPNASIALTSAGGSNNQTLCINTPLTNITYTVSGGGTGATVTGLPGGLTGNYSGGTVTISGTPTALGTYNYTVTTAGTCAQTSTTGSITINPNAAIGQTSAAGTTTQTLCLTASLTTITYTVSGGGTGANVTGLPPGLTGTYAGGTVTISGTPTSLGTFNYTVTTTGSCTQTGATGSITINPNAAITLTSAAGTDAQTLCVNTPLTTITYSVSGGGTGATVTGLPAGLTGNYSGGTVTISGTPTVVGTFNYTVTTTGICTQTSATGNIVGNPNTIVTLTSASGTDIQTLCLTDPLTTITYSISGGGTGATVTGLPAGVTGNYAGGLVTISGTPTALGTYNYTLITSGGCSPVTVFGSITINPNAAIALTSAGGTDAQTVCINTALTNITYTVSGGGTGANVTGLPTGVTWNYAAGVVTISGSPTQLGTYNYTVQTTGTCTQAAIAGSITITPDASIVLTSGGGTTAQTLCSTDPLTTITYSVSGGGTGATVSGLPNGVTGNYAGGIVTISGTPIVQGTYNYIVTTTGTCIQKTATGSITINPNAAIALTSAAGTDAQTVCVNTAIINITYTVSGGGTGATIAGLPNGVTGIYSAGVVTISGSPTALGTFNYTVTTTGTCTQTSVTGSIIINPDASIALTSGGGTTAQTLCLTNPLITITYTVGGGGTGATITGLPSGVTGNYAGGVVTISGTPTQLGTFNYIVATTGTCIQKTATGSIIINPNAAIALTSAAGTTAQTLCVNTALTPITYTVSGGGSGATITGLPNGVTGIYSSGVVTISGSPTIIGTYNYTVQTTGTCTQTSATGSITIDQIPTARVGLNTTVCQNQTAIVSGASASYGSISWAHNGKGSIASGASPLTPIYSAAAGDAGNAVILTMTVTSTNSCAPKTAADTYTVNVRPTLTVGSSVSKDRVCENDPAQIIFTATNGTPPFTFTYKVNGGALQTATTINGNNAAAIGATNTPPGFYTYQITNIQDANCSNPTTSSATQTILPLPIAGISGGGDVCRNGKSPAILFAVSNGTKPYTLDFKVNSDNATKISTKDNDTTVSYTPMSDKVGVFVYSLIGVTDNNGCHQAQSGTASVEVHENPHPIFTIAPENTTVLEPTITVTDASISTTSWMWDFGDGSISPMQNPEPHNYADTGTYKIKLVVMNTICKDSTYETVHITLPLMLYIPNTFSPNGDGVNDVFQVKGDGILKFEMLIYDRWGNLIFITDDINKGWDGKANSGSEIAQIDTYVYVINLKALSNKHDYTYRGIVNLIK